MELRKISKEELNKIIEDHQHWLKEDCEGWKNMRGNLKDIDLRGLDLSCADLRSVDLSNTDLTYAILSNTDLRSVDLSNTDLTYADLSYTDLRGANLIDANLSYTDLKGADLRDVNLRGANLSYADLSYADLKGADLRGANLSEVNYNHLTAFLSLQCPEEGSFIGYKKSGDKIVKLRIEEDSKRSSATTRKCRASKVAVLSITSIDGKEEFKKAENTGEYSFTYEVGKTYEIEDFDEDRWNECSTGIHFFITRDEAVKY